MCDQAPRCDCRAAIRRHNICGVLVLGGLYAVFATVLAYFGALAWSMSELRMTVFFVLIEAIWTSFFAYLVYDSGVLSVRALLTGRRAVIAGVKRLALPSLPIMAL